MESSLTGNYEVFQNSSEMELSQKLRRNASKSSSKRAFQEFQPKQSPVEGSVNAHPAKPPKFSSIEFPDEPIVSKPLQPSFRRASKDEDDYDNIILPTKSSSQDLTHYPASALKHPGPIKINSMRLGEHESGGFSGFPASASKNPIKNLLRKLKSQPRNTKEQTSPRQSSTVSLNEPPGMHAMYDLHKSNSVGEAWSESSSLSSYSHDRLPVQSGRGIFIA